MLEVQTRQFLRLTGICRCCHLDGSFKSLQETYKYKGKTEVYYKMLIETFGMLIPPPTIEASYTICDECIVRLRDSTKFRNQIEACEDKFNQYCSQFNQQPVVENNHDSETVQVKKERNYFDNIVNEFKTKNLTDTNEEYGFSIRDEEQDYNDDVKPNNIEFGNIYVKDTVYEPGIDYDLKKADKNHEKVVDKNQDVKIVNKMVCRFCKMQVRENQYNHHLKSHVQKTECIYCCKTFDTIDLLKKHSEEHKYENMYTCDFCQKRFIGRSTLIRHINLHHMGKSRQFMCDECGMLCNDISNLRSHSRTVHQKLKLFKCSVCHKKLSSKKSLKVHIRIHTGERPYVCEECGDGFICFTRLKQHRIKHDISKMDGSKYICKFCHMIFHKNSVLIDHVSSKHPGRLPTTVRKYRRKYLPCPRCNKVFSHQYSLDRHIATHGDTVEVSCGLCNKMFVDKCSLWRHMRNIHTPTVKVIKEKVQCKLCKRNVYDIKRHMTVHTDRPMNCKTCGKNYPDKKNLLRHMRNVHHDIDKTFQCKKCDRRPYTRKKYLRTHMQKKHGCDLKAGDE